MPLGVCKHCNSIYHDSEDCSIAIEYRRRLRDNNLPAGADSSVSSPAGQEDVIAANAWWASLGAGACVNAMWEEATGNYVPGEHRVLWLWRRYGKTVGVQDDKA
jgi:hypothetical protein